MLSGGEGSLVQLQSISSAVSLSNSFVQGLWSFEVGMIGCVADDLFADYFASFMKQERVDTRFVKRVAGFGTQLCVGEVRPPFRQVFYRHKPADTQLEIGPEELEAISGARLFVTNGESVIPTNLVFTATIQVKSSAILPGRPPTGNFMPPG